LRATGAETVTAKNRPPRLWLERHGVSLAALIANDFETLALAAATSLLWSTKIRATRITTRLAALRVTQSALTIVILLTFTKWEGGSALGTSNFQIWHNYLPRKILRGFYWCEVYSTPT